MTKVKLENFSKLSNQECALALQSHLLEALAIEDPTYLEWEMANKFISIDYPSRISLGKLLNYYLRRNNQNIAGISVNVWLRKYLEKNQGVSREPDTFYQYSTNNSEINKLSEKDQIKLMRIFRLYDYFLIKPIVNWDDTAAEYIMRFPMYLSQSLQEIKAEMGKVFKEKSSIVQKASEKVAIKQALQNYPKLSEQMITSQSIKLKSFDRPVRPSIRNWLYDYTSHLGQTGHGSMDRTNYLFRSENTRNLSSQERGKLGIILKSFDENTPLSIDTENQNVVFSGQEQMIGEQRAGIPSAPSQSPRDMFASSQSAASENASAKTQMPSRPADESTRNTQYNIPARNATHSAASGPGTKQRFSQSGSITYVNPYPIPGTHESPSEKRKGSDATAGSSPFVLKGFSEGTVPAANQPGVIKTPQKKPGFQAAPPKTYIPSRPKNIIYPHSRPSAKEKSEPRLDGNIVDLREE